MKDNQEHAKKGPPEKKRTSNTVMRLLNIDKPVQKQSQKLQKSTKDKGLSQMKFNKKKLHTSLNNNLTANDNKPKNLYVLQQSLEQKNNDVPQKKQLLESLKGSLMKKPVVIKSKEIQFKKGNLSVYSEMMKKRSDSNKKHSNDCQGENKSKVNSFLNYIDSQKSNESVPISGKNMKANFFLEKIKHNQMKLMRHDFKDAKTSKGQNSLIKYFAVNSIKGSSKKQNQDRAKIHLNQITKI